MSNVIRTEPLGLANLSAGDAEAQFSEKLAEIIEEYKSGRSAGRNASIMMQIDISFLDEEGDTLIASLVKCAAKMPKRKAQGRIVRLEGGVPVVDIDETDETGNRRLPFEVTR